MNKKTELSDLTLMACGTFKMARVVTGHNSWKVVTSLEKEFVEQMLTYFSNGGYKYKKLRRLVFEPFFSLLACKACYA